MKQFFKYTLATIVGITIVAVVGTIILLGIIGAIASSGESPTVLRDNSVYQLDLDASLVDRYQDDPMSALLGEISGSSSSTIGLDDILSNIKKAKNDANVKGIYLKGSFLSSGYASIKEIRDALLDFKDSGKFIIAYADSYTQRSYYLASVADKVLLNPIGMLEWQGIATESAFYKNTLDKLGVEMQIVKVGTFKSAVEPFIETKMSDANREQVTVYISSIWNELVNEVSLSRKISPEKLNQYADEIITFQAPEKTVEYALIDSLVYADQVQDIIKSYMDENDPKLVKHSALKRAPSKEKFDKNKVAVIYAVGEIDGAMNSDGIISTKLVKTIEKAKNDDLVKSVVFRISSPGGSAYGSEQIWRALGELKAEKPLIVSMGDYAASGGYYIACLADTIIAQPNTITGSIGVFGMIPNIKGLNEKIGLSYDGIKTNKHSNAISLNRPFTPEEHNLMQAYVNRTYELFVQRCADGRGVSADAIKAVAEGRVWTGEDALELGLVDKLGGLEDAIQIAVEKAGLTSYRVVEYPEKEDFMTQLMKGFGEDIESSIMKNRLGEHYNTYKMLQNFDKLNMIQARMPYDVVFN